MLIETKDRLPFMGKGLCIASDAAISGNSGIEAGSGIRLDACISGDHGPARIGQRCGVQDNAAAIVNHRPDGRLRLAAIHDDRVIGHGAMIEDREFRADWWPEMNALELPCVRIGSGTVVAVGAMIAESRDMPGKALVSGAPARIRCQSEEPQDGTAWATSEYVQHQACLERGAPLPETTG